MRCITLIILLVFIDSGCASHPAAELDGGKLTDKLIDGLIGSVYKALSLHQAQLKVGQSVAPHYATPRSTIPLQSASQLTSSSKLGQQRELVRGSALSGYAIASQGRRSGIIAAEPDRLDAEAAEQKAEQDEFAEYTKMLEEVPYECVYEGPPAKTELIFPTLGVWTIVGLIPFAAAASKQVWVRYKISTKGVKITGGFGGKDTEIFLYPEMTRIRSRTRLFGDGDLIIQRKNLQIELYNIPYFEKVKNFVLKYAPPKVVRDYNDNPEMKR